MRSAAPSAAEFEARMAEELATCLAEVRRCTEVYLRQAVGAGQDDAARRCAVVGERRLPGCAGRDQQTLKVRDFGRNWASQDLVTTQ